MLKFIKTKLFALAALLFGFFSAAHAALPTEVSTAVDLAKTDLLAAIGMVMGAMVAVWGLMKLARKMGWM